MIEGGMMRRAIAAAFAVMIGAAVSQFFYAGLVPPFPKFLVVATALASGMYLRSWREIALAAFLPAIAWQTYETWVLRAPMLFWMVGGLLLTAEVWASPGFVDTPNRTKSAIGVSHGGEAAAAIVLAGGQGG